MKRGIKAVCFLGVLSILMLTLMGIGEAAVPVKLSFANTQPDNGFHKQYTDFFVKKVDELTKGQIIIQKFMGGQLGGEFETLELAGMGEVFIVVSSLAPSRYAPGLDPTMISFYFPDYASAGRYWSPTNPIYGQIQKTLYDKGKLRHLVTINLGSREMTSNKPVKAPGDLRGIKMRVPEIPEYVAIWKALGCLVTPVAGSEIYSALQAGLIDAQENFITTIAARSMWEIQKYMIMTDHNPMPVHFILSAQIWEKLSPDHRRAIEEAARLTDLEANRILDGMEKDALKKLKDNGMTIITPDRNAFMKAAKPTVDQLLGKLAPGVAQAAEKAIRDTK